MGIIIETIELILRHLIAPVAALSGVVISEIFNRWKRREQLVRILFEKKLDIYLSLCGLHENLVGEVIRAPRDKTLSVDIIGKSDSIISFAQGSTLFISRAVFSIVSEFRAAFKDGLFINPDTGAIAERIIFINKKLRERCGKELGLESLEKNIRYL